MAVLAEAYAAGRSEPFQKTPMRRLLLAVVLLPTMATSAGAACQSLRDRERLAVDRYAARHHWYVTSCKRAHQPHYWGIDCGLIRFSTGSDQGHFVATTCRDAVEATVVNNRVLILQAPDSGFGPLGCVTT